MTGQQTLRDRLEFAGVGLHTGRGTRALVEPAGPGTGLVFRLHGGLEFPATAEHVDDTQRATVL
ncbi:MAG: UDP-3-O-acyl-N-acetylglucosamine deacetylase, partial [Candidatus Eremiobacteraeota bacterium]|nr:UDP-3-O-acyl-N-acetylglucosamine deacetylase [Candidatus Eremiobacteraeota bacterium]